MRKLCFVVPIAQVHRFRWSYFPPLSPVKLTPRNSVCSVQILGHSEAYGQSGRSSNVVCARRLITGTILCLCRNFYTWSITVIRNYCCRCVHYAAVYAVVSQLCFTNEGQNFTHHINNVFNCQNVNENRGTFSAKYRINVFILFLYLFMVI